METIEKKNAKSAILYIVSTPIGNLDDLSYRAVKILGSIDALACEDTRHTRKIYSKYDIPLPKIVFSYHEHNEEFAGKKILTLLGEGKQVALCTDAGTPGVSDPGYRIVSDAIAAGFPVDVIPGPSAVTCALLASGLPTSSFTFKGFPPRKPGQRKRFLEMEKEAPHTLVFFESPHRVQTLLTDALHVLGNRRAAVCIDLTKVFAEIRNDYLENLSKQFEDKQVKGEITVVIAGCNPKFKKEDEEHDEFQFKNI
ncbi:MAG: 16S rRNA (cytidine(1402)-2'-O)-methyltransferase [Candidatus Omnitrophota bacterium]